MAVIVTKENITLNTAGGFLSSYYYNVSNNVTGKILSKVISYSGSDINSVKITIT